MDETQPPKSSHLKLIAAVLAVMVLLAAARYFNVQELLREAVEWVGGLGLWGPAVFIAIYILACILFVPGSLLTLGAGFVWGVAWGTAVVSVASPLGATAAFLVGRYFARGWVSKKMEGNEKFQAIDEAVAGEGWKIVGLTRLSPVFPFNLLNYAFGLTRVRLRDYFFASWIGMLPGTVMYVYFGSIAGDLASLGTDSGAATTPAQWALRIVGLLATVGVTLYITKIAKGALAKKV